jgi:hypothetical protein
VLATVPAVAAVVATLALFAILGGPRHVDPELRAR